MNRALLGAGWAKGKEREREKEPETRESVGSVEKIEDITTVQEAPKEKLNWKRRFWKHCRKFWYCYLLMFVVGAAVGFPILFLVIFPAIAQHLVNTAALPIHSAMMLNPTQNSILYSMVASVKVPKPFTVRLEPFTLSLFRSETLPHIIPYMKVTLPSMKLHGNATVRLDNQTATILNQPEFEAFLTNAVNSETFTMHARGETNAYIGKLKAHLKLDKSISLNGLNTLKGFSIDNARAVLPPDSDGTNLVGNITLPNASLVTLALGNLTLNLKVNSTLIGTASLQNVLLRPGNNTLSTRATIDLKALLMNIEPIITAESNYLRNGNVAVEASGNQTVYNGVHIDYFESVLNNLTVQAQMPVSSILISSLNGLLGIGGEGLQSLASLDEAGFTSLLGVLVGKGF
ncbi:hypothetical protein K432DRAFT_354827 [Lepidopterella palustris CBS 459.81]|uniref:Uncharacterized protein n=1 Tax=Lepidopterella palustris CBS 459.81 TaxID=1314670 RepID=A0A8E2JEJ5_9PEZI|nr:hypothetical protein K432DRAFT_354827 [Lepidopterella palustris CBS 459.81]